MSKDNVSINDLKNITAKVREEMPKINFPEEYYRELAKELNLKPDPTFKDIKKAIKANAETRGEPVDHILIEIYGYLVANTLAFKYRLKK